ncbi:MAG: aspartate--tRNA(Asn) ligase [Oscillospiraceae bacterium]|jgi:nondiscriminating aspartyl-tRNA synthetase|nr:aspartate--tRNA(Asn) ligase [Oscillospiraceae bacterium]
MDSVKTIRAMESAPYSISALAAMKDCGESVTLHGIVHAMRNFGGVRFVVLRRYDGVAQVVTPESVRPPREGDAVEFTGVIVAEPRAPGGFELRAKTVRVLSTPSEPMPVPIHRTNMGLTLDTELSLRPITLRNLRARAVMKLREGLARGFRDSLAARGFTEIHTPKLEALSAEGGANVFRVPYFQQRAVLAQSPQFYKQMMVGVYERVFEVGPVFRAEKHNTARHLNEYTSLDLEMGFIKSFEDVMATETYALARMMETLRGEYAPQLDALKLVPPEISGIPAIRFDEAKARAAEAYGLPRTDPNDLTAEEEQAIGRYAAEKLGSEFVFVTHYPSRKRPVYAMDDPVEPRYTLSFDLLFRGMEVTTGGQRIHDYDSQVEKITSRGLDPAGFECYLMIHRYGMPPHGGLGMGLERLLKQLIGASNIRQACLFPRDTTRLSP